MLDRHEIPTHLGVQDRFFYGLTMAQLALLVGGGSCAWVAWQDGAALPPVLRDGSAAALLLLALAVAVVRPGGRSLPLWALVLLRYAATPKRSVWRPCASMAAADGPDSLEWAPLRPALAWAPAAAAEGRP